MDATEKKERCQTLVSFLNRNDFAGFKVFLRRSKRETIDTNDENIFFINAPKPWLRAFLKVHWPGILSERILLVLYDSELITLSYHKWGMLYQDNIIWAFEEGPAVACERIIDLLDQSDPTLEEALLKRNDFHLFDLWLAKFHTLSEDAERLLNEAYELMPIRQHYIDHQLARG
jgi:hypothetical protein